MTLMLFFIFLRLGFRVLTNHFIFIFLLKRKLLLAAFSVPHHTAAVWSSTNGDKVVSALLFLFFFFAPTLRLRSGGALKSITSSGLLRDGIVP